MTGDVGIKRCLDQGNECCYDPPAGRERETGRPWDATHDSAECLGYEAQRVGPLLTISEAPSGGFAQAEWVEDGEPRIGGFDLGERSERRVRAMSQGQGAEIY